ncbi:MAG: rod shape-determining protein MreC [Saprospiraceae bacterium]|jgi:rod shape-determining protein MreC|nr:rod shape-determining protein MreC [Saprospiraceae bacterium]
MYNVIQLFAKYGAHILFIILEVVCFALIINYNKTQKDIFLNSSNVFAAKLSEQQNKILQFTNLKAQNDSLMRENATLIENIITSEYLTDKIPAADSLLNQYTLIPTIISSTTIHKRNNYLTLNKGYREGIRSDMGVIASHKGIVGIVRNISENYSQVISLLHSQTKISCAIKNRMGHGSLVWKNMDPLRMTLESIPKHETIAIGDTVITSGYSTMFPKGILVGKIETYNVIPGSNSYNITVKLFNDLTNIKYAYVIQNRFAAEQATLEKEVANE